MGDADAIIHQLEGRVVRASTYTWGQMYLGGQTGKDEATSLEFFFKVLETVCTSRRLKQRKQ
jgi:hypothetical protein